MQRFTLISTLVLSAALANVAAADVVGGRVGVNLWTEAYDGDVASGGADIDLERDLGYDDETGSSFYAQFEHPVPVLPNVMLAYTEMDANADGELNNVVFDDISYNGEVSSSLDISHTDLTLYYEVLDNWVHLDVGLTGRYFPEDLSITDVNTGLNGSLDLDYVIPMIYSEVRVDLPLTGLSVGLMGNAVSYDGDDFYDLSAKVAYTFGFGLGVEGGYRIFKLDYEDDDEFAEVSIDGAFIGVYWDF